MVHPRTGILWESNYADWVKQDCGKTFRKVSGLKERKGERVL